MPPPTPAQLERNIRLYPAYAAAFNAFAWMPVFFLYLSDNLSLPLVLQLESIYYASVVVMEVPSGYFSDRVGRRATLLISAISLTAAYTLFVVGGSFAVFAAAQVCLAAGIAFNSGTDTSFHFDSLKALKREGEYEDREAIVARNGFIAGALAALAGGAVGLIELWLAYAISLVAAVFSVGLVWAFREPHPHEQVVNADGEVECVEETPGILKQMMLCVGFLKQGTLAWLFAFAVFMLILNHVPYEFFQPYIKIAMAESANSNAGASAVVENGDVARDQWAPLIAGMHMFASMLLASKAAAISSKLRERLGTATALLLAAGLQSAIIATMAFVMHWWVVPLILLRVMPRGLMTAPLNAAIAPRVPQAQRATYFSLQSLAGKLSFSLTLAGMSVIVGEFENPTAASLAEMLRWYTLIAVCGLLLLTCTAWCVKSVSEQAINED